MPTEDYEAYASAFQSRDDGKDEAAMAAMAPLEEKRGWMESITLSQDTQARRSVLQIAGCCVVVAACCIICSISVSKGNLLLMLPLLAVGAVGAAAAGAAAGAAALRRKRLLSSDRLAVCRRVHFPFPAS